MQKQKFTVEIITPTIMGGVDSRHLDLNKIRTSEIKSIMRTVFRFVAGKYINHDKNGIRELLEKEGEIFGNTKNKAKFRLFTDNTDNLKTQRIKLLPHKSNFSKEAVVENQTFNLNLINYYPEEYPTDFYKALLKVAFLFGIGNRRNRFTGNMKLSGENFSLIDEIKIIENICKKIFNNKEKQIDEPLFPSYTYKTDGTTKNFKVIGIPLKRSFVRDNRLDFENILKTLYKKVIHEIEKQRDIGPILGSAKPRQASFVNFSLYKKNGNYRLFIISTYYKNDRLDYQRWEKGVSELEKLTKNAFEFRTEGNKEGNKNA